MSDPDQTVQDQKPPQGDHSKAEEYISKLIKLISLDRVKVVKTDLKKFDPTTLQNHYRIDLAEYQIEVSHSKDPNSGKDSYVMVFTNISKINSENNPNQKIILAYMHLNPDQFHRLKEEAESQIEKIRKEEEQKRFNEAIQPIDQALENLENGHQSELVHQSDQPQPEHHLKEYDIEPKFSL